MKTIVTVLATAALWTGISTAYAEDTDRSSQQIERLKSQLASRFQKADANRDGQLTREEAMKGMPRVQQHFDEIDVEKKGYATMDQIEAYFADKASARAQSKQSAKTTAL